VRFRLTPDTLLVGVLLLFTLGIALFAVRSGQDHQEKEPDFPARRSTFSTQPGGYQALFTALEELDYPVRRWRFALDTFNEPGTLIVAAPENPITVAEWRALSRWVARGNLLIYLMEFTEAGADELERLIAPPERTSRPSLPAPVVAAAPELRTRSSFPIPVNWAPWGAPSERRAGGLAAPRSRPAFRPTPVAPLYQDERGPTVACAQWGRGTIILSSSPWSLGTTGLRRGANNFAWLLATIGAYAPRSGGGRYSVLGVGSTVLGSSEHPTPNPPAARVPEHPTPNTQALLPVWFDEYHHGHGQGRGVLSLLAPIARLGLAQLVAAWLLLTFAASRRFGGRVPDEDRVRRSRSEYLSGMASLLRRARAVDLAAAQVRRQFLNDAVRALGLPRDTNEEALLAVAPSRGIDAERLRSLLARVDRLAQGPNRGHQEEALAVARELVRLRRQLSGEPPRLIGDASAPTAPDPVHSPLTTHHSHD
jgi:hypothetical protein